MAIPFYKLLPSLRILIIQSSEEERVTSDISIQLKDSDILYKSAYKWVLRHLMLRRIFYKLTLGKSRLSHGVM